MKKKKKQSWLIVMLNLWVNDTITMPTPCNRYGNQLYCIDRLDKSPPHPGVVCVCMFVCECVPVCLTTQRRHLSRVQFCPLKDACCN